MILRFFTSLFILLLSINSLAITQSEDAVAGRWQSMAALAKADKSIAEGFYCAASLIAPQWAITAAHCVNGLQVDDIDIVTNLYALDQSAGSQRSAVSEIIVHPDVNLLSLRADIALIKLSTASTAPVMAVFSGPSSLSGAHATIIGWGYDEFGGQDSNILQQVTLPIVSNQICAAAYQQSLTIQASMICAGQGNDEGGGMLGPSLCTHDSGGPLISQIEMQDVLVGVASFSLGCGVAGYSGFMRTSSFIDFLQANIAGLIFVEQAAISSLPPILMLLLDG